MSLIPEAKKTQYNTDSAKVARQQFHHRSNEALISHFLPNDEHLWSNLPVPSVADPTDENLLRPKTLLECCRDAQELLDEYDLNDGFDNQTLNIMRIYGHRTRMLGQFHALQYHAEGNDRHGYLWTLTNILRLVFNMANEAGLESVLSAAYSLKHATDMEKSFLTQDGALARISQSCAVRRSSFPGVQRVIEFRAPLVTGVTLCTTFKASSDNH